MGLSTDPHLEAAASASETEGWTSWRQQVQRWEDGEDEAGLARAGGPAGGGKVHPGNRGDRRSLRCWLRTVQF